MQRFSGSVPVRLEFSGGFGWAIEVHSTGGAVWCGAVHPAMAGGMLPPAPGMPVTGAPTDFRRPLGIGVLGIVVGSARYRTRRRNRRRNRRA